MHGVFMHSLDKDLSYTVSCKSRCLLLALQVGSLSPPERRRVALEGGSLQMS